LARVHSINLSWLTFSLEAEVPVSFGVRAAGAINKKRVTWGRLPVV